MAKIEGRMGPGATRAPKQGPVDGSIGGPSNPATLRHRRLHVLARRLLNPLVLRLGLAGARHSPIGLVYTVGRRSGQSRATPLAVHRRGDRLFVPLTYGPAARWVFNLEAVGACRIRLDGTDLSAVEPRLVGRSALPRSLAAAYRIVGMDDFLELRVAGGVPSRDAERARRR